ncbi:MULTISPECIES: hypothetical protein [unclassified Roseofilum]|uniref:hypothetical protein n=1 Tax=unclassified Roseofilum TaxID=2620099 RepID=UPI000E921606|nr:MULTISPECIES: hypothetical protein [unclassified Roseofilum]MBP0008781.1 hypothetical protein [Roseofilum sp. Belize Diploria]MBP0032278.1 hypothetical protein [Roseofilum sp. Belize BBD 4]HBQ99324.1 hypothetical protein [Cyanobacteria bacterium UBA11691]
MAQPNPAEITDALNSVLQPQGVTAKALVKEGCLHILLEGENIPEQEEYVAIVHDEILNMGIDSFPTLQIYGRQIGSKKPSWSDTIDLLQGKEDEEELPNFALDDPDEDLNSYNGNDLDGAEPLDSELDESGEQKKSGAKKFLPLLAIPIVALIGAAVWWFFLRPAPAPLLPATAPEIAPETAVPETAIESPPETTEPEATPANPASVPPASTNPWREGINLAISAAELAQTASTRAEWAEVSSQWQQARDLMAQVPEDSENYGAAQERVVTYGENANSAQIWADRSN